MIHKNQEKKQSVFTDQKLLKYVLFAAYSAVGNGVGSFYSMRAKAVVDNHMGSVVTAPLLEINDHAYWVCIAHIDFTQFK